MEKVPDELVNLDKEIPRQNTKNVSWLLLAHVMSYFSEEMGSEKNWPVYKQNWEGTQEFRTR